jgi:hypothetical protein
MVEVRHSHQVVGCIVSPCQGTPAFLVAAGLSVGGNIQLDVQLQVCRDHLRALGWDPDRTDDVGYPTRSTYFAAAQIHTTGQVPRFLRIVRELVPEPDKP